MTWNITNPCSPQSSPDVFEERCALLEQYQDWTDSWDAISPFFCSVHQAAAQHCLRCLFDEDNATSAHQKVSAFITLKSLADPDFQSCFQSELSPERARFSILDVQGEVIPGLSCSLSSPVQSAGYRRTAQDKVDRGFQLAEEMNRLHPLHLRNDEALTHLDRLVIFGDSLSDSHARMFHKSFGVLPSADQNYRGRFTNGFVWADFISSPAFLKKTMVNYAEGGSPSASYPSRFGGWLDMLMWFFSSLNKQMNHHQGQVGDLTILSLGSNDYMTYHKGDVKKVIDNQVENIEKLLAQGVKNILVFGVPDLSLTPYARHLPQHNEQQRLWEVSCQHNQQLEMKVDELQAAHPDATFVFFDISQAFADVFIQAEIDGYNVVDAYNRKGYVHLFGKHYGINIEPSYLFNDDVHPTQEVHWILALMAESVIRTHFAH